MSSDAVRRFVEDHGLRGVRGLGCEVFEARAAGAGFLRQESEELEIAGGQAGGDEGAESGIGAGDGNDGDAGGDGFGDEPGAGIADAGHACIGDDGDESAVLQRGDQLGGTITLVVLMEADGRCGDGEVVEELLRLARVFAGDAVSVLENFKGAEGDVAEVADGRGDEVEAGSERSVGHCLEHGSASRFPPNSRRRTAEGKSRLLTRAQSDLLSLTAYDQTRPALSWKLS